MIKGTEWYKSRPKVVQKAMLIWLPGDKFQIEGRILHLVGFSETDEAEKSGDPYDLQLMLSEINPNENYDGACHSVERFCAKHFKRAAEGEDGRNNQQHN